MIINIFGDTNQLMKPNRGISDWSLLDALFHPKRFSLNENYRNTNQITRFCNKNFLMDVKETGVDGVKVREIPRSDLEAELNELKPSTERIAILMSRGNPKKKYLKSEKISPQISSCMDESLEKGHISLMYVDEVKGIEFDQVFVIPDQMTQNEKYIAYTRALSELIIVIDRF